MEAQIRRHADPLDYDPTRLTLAMAHPL